MFINRLSEVFSTLLYLDATKCVSLSVVILIETIRWKEIWP